MNIDDIRFEVGPCNGGVKRLVIVTVQEEEVHRSTVNTNSADSRRHFLKRLAEKVEGDASDLIKRFDQRLVHLADQADAAADEGGDERGDEEGGEGTERRKSQATLLVEMVVRKGAELFHDPDGNAFARFKVVDHFEVARINSGSFKRWMSKLYFEETGTAPNSQAKADAAAVLEGKALHDGPERKVFVRVGEHEGRIYLDLCNDKWQPEEVIWREFEEARPALLGYLLTIVSAGLKRLPTMEPLPLPRMADFALWILAAEPAIGWKAGSFLSQYTGNREEADHLAIESSLIGKPLMDLLESTGGWEGTATDLLREVERSAGYAESTNKKPKGWPGSAKAMSGAVKRLAPHLRKIGWECETRREEGRERRRLISFRSTGQSCVRSVRTVQTVNDSGVSPAPLRTQADEGPPPRTNGPLGDPDARTHSDDSDASLRPQSDGGQEEIGEL